MFVNASILPTSSVRLCEIKVLKNVTCMKNVIGCTFRYVVIDNDVNIPRVIKVSSAASI